MDNKKIIQTYIFMHRYFSRTQMRKKRPISRAINFCELMLREDLLIRQSEKAELIFLYLFIFVSISRNWKIFRQFILFPQNGKKLK